MISKPVPPRIFGIVASEAPVAVVFMRHPAKHTQLLEWNLETDEVRSGQWIKGRVFWRRCDLSPDGKLLVCAISNYSKKRSERAAKEQGLESWMTSFWTAVSRPPYFSALALWFFGPSYNGGGSWESNKVLGLNNQPYKYYEVKPMKRGYRSHDLDLGPSEDHWIWLHLLKKRGWTKIPDKHYGNGDLCDSIRSLQFKHGEIRYWEKYGWGLKFWWELRDKKGNVVRRWEGRQRETVWLDVDHRGRVLMAENGCLYAWSDFPKGEPKLVADLSGNRFEEVAPPDWAMSWPASL